MKNRGLLVFIALIMLVACKNDGPYEGYSKTHKGVYYKLHRIGESSVKPLAGDYITADFEYKTMNDSSFFNGRRKVQVLNEESGVLHSCLQMLAADEAATFILAADDFFRKSLESKTPSFLAPSDSIKLFVHVHEIQTEKEYELEKAAFLKWVDDFGAYEKEILNQFISQQQIKITPNPEGFYRLVLREGNGKTVQMGDTLVLHYEGKFLNGRFFDSTIRRKEAFGFVYGTEWQVVEGLEEAIGEMKEGEKSLIILPSELAFGESGSSTGIIPPYTSVIFEVELVSIN